MKKKKNKNRASIFGIMRDIFVTLVLIGITSASICGVAFAVYINQYILPQANIEITGLTMNLSSVIYYEDSETGEYLELEKLHGEQNRIWVGLDSIPDDLQKAFVSIEDERFYEHSGVDWYRTAGAAANWILPLGDSFGGSTITQQLVKNITADDDFKVTRKITEILRALNIEKQLEKDQILELYLNTIYFGRSAYGVNTAAMTYFGKDLADLNLAECAALAGITNNPSLYDPFRFPENVKSRQTVILNQMYSLGYITSSELSSALSYELEYVYEVNEEIVSTSQSYYVDVVIEDVIEDLMEQKGYSYQVASQLLYSGGLEIYAAVDMEIQTIMEEIYLDDANFPDITGVNGEVPQSSMVIMDPNTGYVVGLVGGRGEKEGNRILNYATQTTRQPGSAIKPIGVYAPAIDQGLITPISVYDDAPVNFTDNEDGYPTNYYSGYRGRMNVIQGMYNSVNTLAMQVLQDLGTQESYNFLTANLGITTLDPDSDPFLAPLALGGLTNGVTVLELTAAYVPFANEGYYYEPITYTKVVDSTGTIILENTPQSLSVFNDEDTVYYMRNLLENVVTYGTAASSGVKVPDMQTIGKTGTTNSSYDLWFAGATPYYVAATWFGYEYPQKVSYSKSAQEVWKTVMHKIHEDLPAANFDSAPDFVTTAYCKDSGLLATEYCSLDVRGSRIAYEKLSPSDVPTEYCTLHTSVPICIYSGGIATEYCPEEGIIDVVLMDLTRLYEKEIYLTDELYTVSYNNAPIGEGVPASRTQGDTAPTYTGTPCDIHTGYIEYEIDPETGLPIYPIDPETGLPIYPDVDDENTDDPNSDVTIPPDLNENEDDEEENDDSDEQLDDDNSSSDIDPSDPEA